MCVIHTLRNITRNLLKSKKYDEVSASAGCAASRINGKTYFRSMRILVGIQKFNNDTTNIVIKNIGGSKHWHEYRKNIFLFMMDDNSMSGRPFWGWFKHRLEEAICGGDVLNPDISSANEHHSSTLYDHSDTFKRTWGGVQMVYSFGYFQQLPPVRRNLLVICLRGQDSILLISKGSLHLLVF